MMEIIRKNVKGFKNAWLVKKNDEHFVLAAGEGKRIGETIVFRSNSSGQVKTWKKEGVFVNIGIDEAAKIFGEKVKA